MFRVIYNSTTADAADMNDNFYWIAQGSVFPMAGTDFNYTSSSNLGSSSKRWDTLYCKNISAGIFNPETSFKYITTAILSSDSSRIEITGLNGERNINIAYFINTQVTNTMVGFIINGLSATTEYSSYANQFNTSTAGGLTTVTTSSINLFFNPLLTSSSFFSHGVIKFDLDSRSAAPTSSVDFTMKMRGYGQAGSGAEFVGYKSHIFFIYSDFYTVTSASNPFSLTSITFLSYGGDMKAGSFITIWKS